MIVVDTSVFLDELFKFDQERHEKARIFFRLVQEGDILIVEPEIFKVELIGQLVRRMEKDEATILYESVVDKLKLIKTEDLDGIAFSIAFETGSRAIDTFYIAAAKIRSVILVSNDKIQVESARKFGVEAYYLLEEFDRVKEKIGRS
ncbi:MAG: type II toxin-antitoxin system VapC family toxin [Methanophagales archaeon]|nr:type II toxin-antitoxin system VapC family toxin [Methanophagales archaeon]